MKQLTKVRFTKHYFGIGIVWYIMFAWRDLWIGVYYDRRMGKIYFCLIPTIVLVIRFNNIRN